MQVTNESEREVQKFNGFHVGDTVRVNSDWKAMFRARGLTGDWITAQGVIQKITVSKLHRWNSVEILFGAEVKTLSVDELELVKPVEREK